jgi:histidine kinase
MAMAFNQMASHLQNIETQRVALIGNVAHELRTPLSNIRITLEGLIDEVFTPDTETFLDIQHEVSRLQRLVYQLERLSQAESGQIPLNKQWVDYAQLIKATCERLKVQYDSKGVDLVYEVSLKLPQIRIDPDHITQVLINLLGNALQYTPAGGRVTIQAHVSGEKIVTSVRDKGIGMQPSELKRIFERFYRIDKSRARSSGGNGIGLTITRHLLLAHQGTISAESAGLGFGSTFTFTLPLSSSNEAIYSPT